MSASPSRSPSPSAVAASPSDLTLIDPRDGGLEVGFGEFAITLEADTIRPGPVTFVIHNAGKLTHGFEMRIEGGGSGSGSGGDEFKIETETFGSGDTVRVDANLPAGRYEIECFVADHDARGMRTFFDVRPDAPLVTPPPVVAEPGLAIIRGFAFEPAQLQIAAGMQVTWTNEDPAAHTVSAVDGSFGSGQLDPGATFQATMDRAGTFDYLCQIHPSMTGTVLAR